MEGMRERENSKNFDNRLFVNVISFFCIRSLVINEYSIWLDVKSRFIKNLR